MKEQELQLQEQNEQEAQEVQEQKDRLIEERRSLESALCQSDYKIVKCAEATVVGLPMPYDTGQLHTERQAMRNRISAINAELKVLNGEEPTAEELLATAKDAKIQQIEEYNISANVNAFTVGGIPMWLNFDQRSRLKNSIVAAEDDGRETLEKVYGGRHFIYPLAVWKKMFTDVENYAGDCQNVTEAHKAAVLEMSTIADVEAFDMTVGYPEHPAFELPDVPLGEANGTVSEEGGE